MMLSHGCGPAYASCLPPAQPQHTTEASLSKQSPLRLCQGLRHSLVTVSSSQRTCLMLMQLRELQHLSAGYMLLLLQGNVVTRIDEGLGLVLELPTEPALTPGFVHISNAGDNKIDKLQQVCLHPLAFPAMQYCQHALLFTPLSSHAARSPAASGLSGGATISLLL